jgi:hypothetical protein
MTFSTIVSRAGGVTLLRNLCASYQAFFNHIDVTMKIMVRLLKIRGRFADEIIQMSAVEQTKFARAQVNGNQYAQL